MPNFYVRYSVILCFHWIQTDRSINKMSQVVGICNGNLKSANIQFVILR